MNKIFGLLTLLFFGIYILFLNYSANALGSYTTEKYFSMIILAAFVSIAVSIVGLLSEFISILKNKNIKLTGFIFNYKKLWLIIISVILGLVVSYFFFILALAILLFLKIKDDKTEKLISSNFWGFPLVVIFIGLGFIIPQTGISSATADQRINNFNGTLVNSTKPSISKNFNESTLSYTIGDWISSLNFNPELSFYKDKEVKISGFIFTPANIENGYFLLSRFVIRCCAADATPVGLKVKYDLGNNYKEDDWVEITGKFSIENKNGTDELVVIPETVIPIDKPSNPYIN